MAGEGLRRRSWFMILLLLLLNGFEATVTISGGDGPTPTSPVGGAVLSG
jgi:hypothetical protein